MIFSHLFFTLRHFTGSCYDLVETMVQLWYYMTIKRGDNMPQIIPIKDLKNTSKISDLCHSTSEPVYITKNGYGDMVIMSMETFEGVSATLNMYQSLMNSEQQIKEGKVHDARESLKSVREKYDL